MRDSSASDATQSAPSRRPFRRVVLVATACCALIALSLLLGANGRGMIGSRVPFDREGWLRNRNYPFVVPIRYRMAKDLVLNHALVGKTTQEIEALLGPPDWRGLSPIRDLEYRLRPASVSDVTSLTFDADGDVVVSVQISHDW